MASVVVNKGDEHCFSAVISEEVLPVEVMLWDEKDAKEKEIRQVGASACGATAALTVLSYFGIDAAAETVVAEVKTKTRDLTAPLLQYLRSRSVAGTSHEDIIEGVTRLTDGQVIGRFFPFFPKREVDLYCWLREWLILGAVPVATLNLQKLEINGNIPDAWHHQMIYGVSESGAHMLNPLEILPFDLIGKTLCSDSILLIQRKDIVSRFDIHMDTTFFDDDNRWHNLKVLEQIEKLGKEEVLLRLYGKELKHHELMTSHITIPAMYKSGITLFVKKNSQAHQHLLVAKELPEVEEVDTNEDCKNCDLKSTLTAVCV